MLKVGAALVSGARAVALALQALSLLMLAHSLGLRDFGVFSLVLLVQGLVAVVSNLGVLGASQFQAGRGEVQRVAGAGLLVTVASSVVLIPPSALVLSWLYPVLLPDLPFDLFVVGLLAAPVRLAQEAIQAVFVGIGDIRGQLLLALANPVLLVVLLSSAVLSGGLHLEVAVILWLVSQLGSLAVGLLELRRHGRAQPPVEITRDRALWRTLLTLGPGAYLTYVAYYLVMRADRFALNVAGGAEAVGVLSLAAWVAESFALVPTAVGAVIFPRLGDASSRHEYVAAATRSMILVSAMLAVPVLIAFAGAATVLDSPGLIAAVPVLALLLPGYILFGLFGIFGSYWWANARTGIPAIYYGVAAIARVAVTLLVYGSGGILGVALGLTIVGATVAFLGATVIARSAGATVAELLVPRQSDLTRLTSVLSETLRMTLVRGRRET